VGRFSITKREREVMDLLFQGKSYKEIEDLLCISLGTVKNHAYNLYRKVGVNSRAQLIHLAINND
jgi:DNA-binding CsgD family transcriptional regulator